MPGATFHCAFCRIRKQRMSKSIQEVTKALITIIFTIIFPYTICSVELLIWQYCEDGKRTVPPDSGLLGVCCVFANAKLQLLEGRLHLENVAFAEEKCIFVCVCVLLLFFYLYWETAKLRFWPTFKYCFRIIRLLPAFKIHNHLKYGSPNLLVQIN